VDNFIETGATFLLKEKFAKENIPLRREKTSMRVLNDEKNV